MELDLIGIFAAGLLTFVSPCILPLVPVYLALLGGASVADLQSGKRSGRTVIAALAFTFGLAVVFIGLGMAATVVGKALVAHRTLLLQLGGLLVFLFGLKFLGVLHLPWLEREYRPMLGARGGRTSFLGAFVVGAAFGLGWTPCIGPVLGSVLTYTATTASSPMVGGAYLALYAAGLGLPLVAVAAVAPLALRWVRRMQRWMQPLQYVTGGLLAVIGLLLITDNVGLLDPTSYTSSAPVATAVAPASPDPGAAQATASVGAGTSPAATCGVCDASQGDCACELPAVDVGALGAPQRLLVGQPQMVEFVSRSCPVCLRMEPVVTAAMESCGGQGVQLQRIEVDSPGGLDLARRHGVLGVPTFVFFDSKGIEVARLVGEQKADTMNQTLQVLAGVQCAGFVPLPSAESKPADATIPGL